MLIYMRFERNILSEAPKVIEERRRALAEAAEEPEADLIPTATPMSGGPIPIDATPQIELDQAIRIDKEGRDEARKG